MALIGPIVANSWFFFVTILALAAIMVLSRHADASGSVLESAAEKRKAQWSARRERLWMTAVLASSFIFIVLVTAEFIYAKSVSALSPATEVSFSNGSLSIPLSQVSDGDLHRYAARAGGTQIRFLLYQKPDSKLWQCSMHARSAARLASLKDQTVWSAECASPINSQSVGLRELQPRSADSSICGDAL